MRRLLGLVLPVALLVAGCGDDGEDAAPATTATAPGDAAGEEADGSTSTTAPTTSTTAEEPAGEGADGGDEDEGAGDVLLVADLTPGSEVPGPGADGGSGRFEAELVDGELCVDLVVSDLGGPVVGAHLHEGGPDVAGGVLVDLGRPTAPSNGGERWDGACVDVPDDVIAGVAAAPEQHYVNVHTTEHPDGAVRGQLAVASVFDRTLG